MSYNNLDYISKLNLENIDTFQFPSENNDLASFTDSSFFDFDKFPASNDTELKSHQQQQFQEQIQQQPQQQNQQQNQQFNDLLSFNNDFNIKQEESDQFALKEFQINSPITQTPLNPETPIQQSTTNSTHIETDKKKRNTAASARFRIKKKLKEQEMERNLKQLNDKVEMFKAKIAKLEMENKCLKSLIIEKNEQKSNELLKQIKERSIVRSD